jgi:WhiB family transcriptional regulator, redox-sensing transcriptional regulator
MAGKAGAMWAPGAETELREDWMGAALCKAHPEVSFFPIRGEPVSKAKAICARCPVCADCLEFALALGERLDGIWGGTSQYQRHQILLRRPRR